MKKHTLSSTFALIDEAVGKVQEKYPYFDVGIIYNGYKMITKEQNI